VSAYATVDELAAALRVRVTEENTDALQACLDAAAEEIDHDVDRIEPIPQDDPLANRVNIVRAVEWYKANDAAFGVIGYDQTGALQAPRDGFNRHAYTLTPLKQQWGLA
jgi:glyoxylate carboligase